MKAKVFLSCGQGKSSNEPIIAGRIAQRIRDDHGFDCYVAVVEQSLLGLRENIFRQLDTADYLVFIDFKREELGTGFQPERAADTKEQVVVTDTGEPIYRGSLFSHQELAIASFLEIPAILLQERGVKQRDGMIGVMQANARDFSDREQLPNIVSGLIGTKVQKKEWHSQSRNLLTLETAPKFEDALNAQSGEQQRSFHIAVRNHHWRKAALNCFAYLDVILDLDTKEESRPDTIEIKWTGTWLPNVRIGPQASRKFDALCFPHQPPLNARFITLSDWTKYHYKIEKPGRHQVTFSVVSQNFAPASKSFVLEFGANLGAVRFSEA